MKRYPMIGEADIGPDGAWNMDELRTRYSVVGSMMRRFCPGLGDEVIDDATRAFAVAREEVKIHRFEGDEAPEGWRMALMCGTGRGSELVAGVRADGVVIQGQRRQSASNDAPPRDRIEPALADVEAETDGWSNRTFQAPHFSLSARGTDAFTPAKETARDLSGLISKIAEEAGASKDQTRQLHAVLQKTLMRVEIQRRGAASRAIREALDPDVRGIMASVNEGSTRYANTLMGVDPRNKDGHDEVAVNDAAPAPRYAADPALAARRQQAVRAYPLLNRVFQGDWVEPRFDETFGALPGEDDTGPRTPRLGDAVDSGTSIHDAFSRYGLSRAQARRLQGLTWQKAGRHFYHNAKTFLEDLSEVDANHVPENRKGFADFRAALDAAKEFSAASGVDKKDAIAQIGGGFDKVARLIEGNPARGIRDFDEYMRRTIVAPAALHAALDTSRDPERAAEWAHEASHNGPPLSAQYPLKGALQASGKWHGRLVALEDAIVERNDGVKWPAVTGEIALKGGIRAVELTSEEDLKREGRVQNHCVGGYTGQVLEGKSLIYSLREGDRILSTVEIDPRREEGESARAMKIRQNYGKRNTEPDQRAKTAARSLAAQLRRLPEEEIDTYQHGIRGLCREREKSQEGVGRMSRDAGYDVLDRRKVEKAWTELAPLMPRQVRKMGLAAFGRAQLEASDKHLGEIVHPEPPRALEM